MVAKHGVVDSNSSFEITFDPNDTPIVAMAFTLSTNLRQKKFRSLRSGEGT